MTRIQALPHTVAVAALLVLVPLAGCLSGGSVQDVGAPVWSPGFAWSWNTTGEVRESIHLVSSGQEPVRNDEIHSLEPFRETIEVLNTTERLDDVPVYVVGYRSSTEHGRTGTSCEPLERTEPGSDTTFCDVDSGGVELAAFRQADLASMPVAYSWRSTCLNGNDNCRYVLDPLRVSGTPPQQPYLDFPLQDGKTWGGPLDEDVVGDDDLEWRYEGRVKGRTSVDTALGPMDTIRVDFIKEPTNLAEWKQSVVQEARAGGAQIDSFDYEVQWRRVVHYSEDVMTVVRSTLQVEERFAASGSEGGERFEVESHVSRETVTVLTGAQLFQKPERDADHIARVLGGEIPLVDPAGGLPDPRRFEVTITPGAATADAFGDDVASFNITVRQEGGTGNSTDVAVAWSIMDYRLRPVAEGNGTRIDHDFELPGAYSIEAVVTDAEDGRPLASTQIPFEVTFTGEWAYSSPVRARFFLSDPPQPFPVLPGITSLVVRAEVDGPMAGLNPNELIVRDATGTEVASGDGREVFIDDFSEYFVNENPWTFEWEVQGAAVFDQVVIAVEERYGGSGGPTLEPQDRLPKVAWDMLDSPSGSFEGGILA